jgi:hypothetical protein
MDERSNLELHLLLGRLDGKMDMLLSQQSIHASKMEATDKRLVNLDQRITSLEASKAEGKSNRSYTISIMSIVIAAGAALKGMFYR